MKRRKGASQVWLKPRNNNLISMVLCGFGEMLPLWFQREGYYRQAVSCFSSTWVLWKCKWICVDQSSPQSNVNICTKRKPWMFALLRCIQQGSCLISPHRQNQLYHPFFVSSENLCHVITFVATEGAIENK